VSYALWLSVLVLILLPLAGAALLCMSSRLLERLLRALVAFASGAMLATALLKLLPESNAHAYALAGVMVLFLMEGLISWHHCHDGTCEVHSFSYMMLVAQSLHSFIHGAVLAASYAVSFELGALATLAILLHQIAQEMSNLGVLVYGGFSKVRALGYLLLTSCLALPGAAAALLAPPEALPPVLGFAAGALIYIAVSDLMPELRGERNPGGILRVAMLMLLGIALVQALGMFFKHPHP